MSYFDCYLIPVTAAKLDAHKRFSEQMARVYREYGAIRVIDCVRDPDRADGTQFHADEAAREGRHHPQSGAGVASGHVGVGRVPTHVTMIGIVPDQL